VGLIDPLLEEGALPNLAALLSQGVRATLRSTVPGLSLSGGQGIRGTRS